MLEVIWLCLGILSPVYLIMLHHRLTRLNLISQRSYRASFHCACLCSGLFHAGYLTVFVATQIVRQEPHLAAFLLNTGEDIHHAGFMLAPAVVASIWLLSFVTNRSAFV